MSALTYRHLIGFFAVLLCLLASLYTVHEGEQSIRLRLGKIVVASGTDMPAVAEPGLHLKWPFFDQVKRFDVRLQTLNVESSRILTKRQKYVLVDYFAKWKIDDLALFYTRTDGIAARAEHLLQEKINDALRAAFGQRTVSDVVTEERGNIMSWLKHQADAGAKNLGIKVIDVRIKRIDLPQEVSMSVYERMRTEREQVATQHRSDGKAAAEAIRAEADANATVLLATARREAARIRAEGLAKAAAAYAKAYQQDSSFYSFYRSLEAYRESFTNKKDVLVLKPDSDFFKYFQHLKGHPAKS